MQVARTRIAKTAISLLAVSCFVALRPAYGYGNDPNIGALIDKPMGQAMRSMSAFRLVKRQRNSSDDDFPGDTRLTYAWHGAHGLITIDCDKKTHRVVFVNASDYDNTNGLGATLDEWRSILQRFGITPDQRPDDTHYAYEMWHHYHGRYFIHVYGYLPGRTTWAIEMARLGERYSGYQ